MPTTEEVSRLFVDWVRAQFSINAEFGTSQAWPAMIEHMKARAQRLELEWSDDYVPEHIWSLMKDWED